MCLNIYFISPCTQICQYLLSQGHKYYKAKTWQQKRNKQMLFIPWQEVTLQQANKTDIMYSCILEVFVIFTVTVLKTSTVKLRSCLFLTVIGSQRAGSRLVAECEPTLHYTVHYRGKCRHALWSCNILLYDHFIWQHFKFIKTAIMW